MTRRKAIYISRKARARLEHRARGARAMLARRSAEERRGARRARCASPARAPREHCASIARAARASRSAARAPRSWLWIHVSSPSRLAAGPENRDPAKGNPRPQPRAVRSAGRDTWKLTGEAPGGPRTGLGIWCSWSRSGRLSAIRRAHSGALDRSEPSDPAARAPIRTRSPYFAADASVSSSAAGARRLLKGSGRAVGAAGGFGTCCTGSGRSRRSGRKVGTPARLGRLPLQAQALC